MEPTKRELRQQKREIKRAGGKRRRRQLKEGLLADPEAARDTEFDFGRYRSSELNGMDHDATRRSPASRSACPDGGPEPDRS